MSRTLWFAAGAGAGVYAMVRARRAAEALTVDGMRDRMSGLAVGARLFREEVDRGRAEKETDLRERLGLVPHGVPELETGRADEGVGTGLDTLAGARNSTSEIAGARHSTSDKESSN